MIKPRFGTPLNRSHPFSKHLLVSYLFNEYHGRIINDSSGNRNHGTMSGFGAEDTPASGWVPGPHGGALAFDDVDDTVTFPVSPTLSGVNHSYIIFIQIPPVPPYCEFNILRFGNHLFARMWLGMPVERAYTPNLTDRGRVTAIDDNRIHMIGTVLKNNELSFVIDGALLPPTYGNPISGNYLDITSGQISSGAWGKRPFIISKLDLYSCAFSAEEIAYLNAFPYCMYEQEDEIYVPSLNDYYYKKLLAGGI